MSLPAVAPASVKAAHRIGIRSGDENFHSLFQGQDAVFVLQQDFRLFGCMKCRFSMLSAAEFGIIFGMSIRSIEKSQSDFQSQHSAYCIVYPRHWHFTLFCQFFQKCAVSEVIGFHGHVDACIYRYFYGFFLVRSYFFPRIEVVYVGPVGYEHSVPVEIFLEPLCKQFIAGVDGNPVYGAAVSHHCQCACFHAGLERCEEFFSED